MNRGVATAALILIAWLAVEGTLARRADLDDHGRFTAAVYATVARNYVRDGFLADGGTPHKNGGAPELAREARYLNWPVRDFIEQGLWFKAFGVSVPVARARTVAWGTLAVAALLVAGLASRRRTGPLLALAFATCPFIAYYAHAAVPQAVTVSAIAIAAAARLRRLEGAGPRALVVQALAVTIAVTTTWEGLLFPLAWAVSDLRARRRDGPILLGLAVLLCAGQGAYAFALGGADAALAKAASRASSPGPLLATLIRIARYSRSLGYGHALLVLAWLVAALGRRRRGEATPLDRAATELLLAPIPWFLVFREHVAIHDIELMYFAPGVALAAWSALDGLAARSRGGLRVALASLMLVVTGGGVAGILEHKDDWTLPRELGVAARESARFDEAVATSSSEFSIVWEADRFVHLEVKTWDDLAKLVARGGKTVPVRFVLPEREADSELGRALAAHHPFMRVASAIVFDLTRNR